MKRVLITGASGFLGHRLLRRLADEGQERLFAVTSRADGMEVPEGVTVETADLLDAGAVKRLMERVSPDACVHLAWDQGNGDYRNASSNYQWLAASILLFSWFRETGGKQFLFAGSSGEYEDRMGGMAETPQPRQMSLYGRCKKSASELFLSCGNMQVQVARCFTVYGPGDTHQFGAIPAAICALLRGETFSCRSPQAVRDYIYIDDAVEALRRLLRSEHCGAVDIGSGIPRPMREVFSEIGKQLGCLERISFCGEAGGDIMLVADHTIMRETLRFTPQTDFSDGIARSIAYWRTQLGAEKGET